MNYDAFDIKKYPTVSVRHGYKEWASTYERSVNDEMDIRLLNRIQTVNWKHINSAIDLACGTGRIGRWLKKQGVQTIDGIDFTPEMLEKASKNNVYNRLINGDILDTKLNSSAYDLCTEVLADEHIKDLKPLYSEASRLCKQGGYFVIVGYHPHFLMNGLITHFHRENGKAVAIESYVHLISHHVKAALEAGFKLLEMDEGIIDEAWLNKKPKWEKFKNRPVSFILVWKKNAT